MQIFNCEQGTDDWFECRKGIPTASMFKTVMAEGKSGEASKTRRTYLYKLAGEILTGRQMESYSNSDMDRGKEQEPEARDLYCFLASSDLAQVGFVKNHGAGCSPDALIGKKGGAEFKSAAPHIQIARLVSGGLPSEHRAQVQGGIWICEREWWDFMSYCPGIKPFLLRVYRDDEYINSLSTAVSQFNEELAALVGQLGGTMPEAKAA